MTDPDQAILPGRIDVHGRILPERVLEFREVAAGRFVSDTVPLGDPGAFRVHVEANLVDLPPSAGAKVLENLRKLRAQIAQFEAKIQALQDQPGDHGAAIDALQVALANRRDAFRRLLQAHGGFAESTLSFAVHAIPIVVSGDGQTAPPGSFLPSPLVVGLVKVDRATRIRVSDLVIRWTADGGTLDAATTVTDASGETANRLRLPSSPGTVRVTAGDDIGGQHGPIVTLDEGAEDPSPTVEIPPEPAFDVTIVGDGRTAQHQTSIVERGDDLLPMIVRVVDAGSPDRVMSLVPVAFEVVEGHGVFLHAPGLATWTNGAGEAGIYFIPTSAGSCTVRARVFRKASARARTVLFHFDAQLPSLAYVAKPAALTLPGCAVDRPFRVRVTGLEGKAMARETVRFRLGAGAPAKAGFFTSETAITDGNGYAASAFVVSPDASPGTIPVAIDLPGFAKPDGSRVSVQTSFTVESEAQRIARGEPVFERVSSGNGAVGHKKFYTKVPFVVQSLAGGVTNRMNFAVIEGDGHLRPAIGTKVQGNDEFIRSRFPDRNVTDVLTLEMVDQTAGVFYEAADDDRPGVVAAFVDLSTVFLTVYGAVSPPDVRIVSLDGSPLGAITPADPRGIDLDRDGFLVEARMPVGFDLAFEGRLATLTRLGELAQDALEYAAPTHLEAIALQPILQDSLGTTWRSSPDNPIVPILETFPDPSDKPELSGGYLPIQVPDHGWLLPKTILVGEEVNKEAGRIGNVRLWVASANFYTGRDAADLTVPPAGSAVSTEAAPPILSKSGISYQDETLTEVPVVFQFQCESSEEADYYIWSFGGTVEHPSGLGLEKRTKSPILYVWFQEGADDLSRDGQTPLSPIILHMAESEGNLRVEWKFFVRGWAEPEIRADPASPVGELIIQEFRVATRKSQFEEIDLSSMTPAQLNATFPEFTRHDWPENDQESQLDDYFADLPGAGDPDMPGFAGQLRDLLGLTLEQYQEPGRDRFGPQQRIAWLGELEGTLAGTIERFFTLESLDPIFEAAGGERPPVRLPHTKIYGLGLNKWVGAVVDENDLGQIVMTHEWTHVLEDTSMHLWDLPADPKPEVILSPQYHGILVGRSVESFRRLYQSVSQGMTPLERKVERLKAKVDFFTFLEAHGEIGAYSQEIRSIDKGHASYDMHNNATRSFIIAYCGALGASFRAWDPEQTTHVPADDTKGVVRPALLSYFQTVYDMATAESRFPGIAGGTLRTTDSDFLDKLLLSGTDENNPYVIYRPE